MAEGRRLEHTFASANLPPPQQVVDCGSYDTIVNLLARTNMLALTSRRLLAASFASGLLQPIPVALRTPSYTVGLYTRIDTPLTWAAAAMAKTITSVARNLAHSTR